MDRPSNIAVVGGGLAGLTAATAAARAGANVTLFEQGRAPGGRAQTLERDGVFLNVGPHALYRNGAAARILRSFGISWCSFSLTPPRSCTTSRSRLSIRRLLLSQSSTLVLPSERPSR